jgi:uncharacterized protein with HEPN domain
MSFRDDAARLRDILTAIENIEKYTARGREAFFRDELVQTWMVHHIEIIGESAGRLTEPFRAAHPEIPWRSIVAMRNVLVHEYFGIDHEQVWAVVETDLPALKERLGGILGTAMAPP